MEQAFFSPTADRIFSPYQSYESIAVEQEESANLYPIALQPT